MAKISRQSAGFWLLVAMVQICPAQAPLQLDEARPSKAPNPVSLLKEGYAAGVSADMEDRLYLLGVLSYAAGEIEPSLCRQWSEELFALSFKLPLDWTRVAHEKNALVSLAAIDPARSFQLLHTVDNPVAMPDGSMPEDVRADAATYIFPAYWKAGHTARKLQSIGTQAERLGNTGQYPYLAVFPILKETFKTNEGESYSIFYKALGYYRLGSKSEREDEDFVEALDALWPALPDELKHAALSVAVARLTSDQAKTYPGSVYSARVATSQGSATINNRALLQLYRLLPRVRELNAKWADQLVASYPLQGDKPSTNPNIVSSGEMTIKFDASRTTSAQIQALTQQASAMAQYSSAMDLALTDPSRASLLSASFSDWQQVALLAQEATGYATSDPRKAEELLKQASSQLDSLKDPTGRFNATVMVTQAAVALKETALAAKTLADGFDLGGELSDEQTESRVNLPAYDTRYFNGLEQLTFAGIQFDANGTVDKLRQLANPALRADLLGDAAQIIYSNNKGKQ